MTVMCGNVGSSMHTLRLRVKDQWVSAKPLGIKANSRLNRCTRRLTRLTDERVNENPVRLVPSALPNAPFSDIDD